MNKIKVRWTKQAHTDKITIDKLQFVTNIALSCNAPEQMQIIINKQLCHIKYYSCIGQYNLNLDEICLFSDGIPFFTSENKYTVEEQIAKTISHEIMHRVLFYEHGEDTTCMFDNIAKSLKAHGMW